MAMTQAYWKLLSKTPALPRSSHCLVATTSGKALLYGGELKPREAVDADESSKGLVRLFDVQVRTNSNASKSESANWVSQKAAGDVVPIPRVGAATTILNDKMYMFGGRGGVDMAPIEGEQAGLWRCSAGEQGPLVRWEGLEALNEADAPQARSYHAMAAYNDQVFVHAGCPASGRLSELHAYSLTSKSWNVLANGPDPGRGGTVLISARLQNKPVLLRHAGFAGYELGADHTIDVYDIGANKWSTVSPSPDSGAGSPGARSVHGFASYSSRKHPDAIAVLYHGERDPSSLGHAGAGAFWDDVWLLLQDDVGGLAWKKVEVASAERPAGRGWFPSASYQNGVAGTTVLLHGGLLSSNERSDELWSLEID